MHSCMIELVCDYSVALVRLGKRLPKTVIMLTRNFARVEAQKHVLPWLTKTTKSQLSPLEIIPNNPTDLLSLLQTDIHFKSKVEFDFVASNVGLL